MKELKEMPTNGQFVAIYTYNGEIWSGSYLWDDEGLITEYCLHENEFVHVGGMGDIHSLPWVCNKYTNPRFFVVG